MYHPNLKLNDCLMVLVPSTSDFLSNLLVLLIRVVNTGLSDSGLLAHLSEGTAGTLSGIGHSTPYEELATYSCVPPAHQCTCLTDVPCSLAVNYLFLANDGADIRTDLVIEPFNAVNEQNDYEVCRRYCDNTVSIV